MFLTARRISSHENGFYFSVMPQPTVETDVKSHIFTNDSHDSMVKCETCEKKTWSTSYDTVPNFSNIMVRSDLNIYSLFLMYGFARLYLFHTRNLAWTIIIYVLIMLLSKMA